jgi:hypothetical protein
VAVFETLEAVNGLDVGPSGPNPRFCSLQPEKYPGESTSIMVPQSFQKVLILPTMFRLSDNLRFTNDSPESKWTGKNLIILNSAVVYFSYDLEKQVSIFYTFLFRNESSGLGPSDFNF